MKSLSISLTPSGAFCLHIPTPSPHNIIIPVTEQGASLLAATIRDWTAATPLATPGNPIQAMIDAELRGESWGQPLQLAGKRRRFSEIKAATGIAVRVCKPFERAKRAKKLKVTLADLGL